MQVLTRIEERAVEHETPEQRDVQMEPLRQTMEQDLVSSNWIRPKFW